MSFILITDLSETESWVNWYLQLSYFASIIILRCRDFRSVGHVKQNNIIILSHHEDGSVGPVKHHINLVSPNVA